MKYHGKTIFDITAWFTSLENDTGAEQKGLSIYLNDLYCINSILHVWLFLYTYSKRQRLRMSRQRELVHFYVG